MSRPDTHGAPARDHVVLDGYGGQKARGMGRPAVPSVRSPTSAHSPLRCRISAAMLMVFSECLRAAAGRYASRGSMSPHCLRLLHPGAETRGKRAGPAMSFENHPPLGRSDHTSRPAPASSNSGLKIDVEHPEMNSVLRRPAALGTRQRPALSASVWHHSRAVPNHRRAVGRHRIAHRHSVPRAWRRHGWVA